MSSESRKADEFFRRLLEIRSAGTPEEMCDLLGQLTVFVVRLQENNENVDFHAVLEHVNERMRDDLRATGPQRKMVEINRARRATRQARSQAVPSLQPSESNSNSDSTCQTTCYIYKLPVELLLRIFQKAYLDEILEACGDMYGPESTTHLALAATSRHFRTIICSDASFWSHISNTMSDDHLRMCMDRWGDAPITVTFWLCEFVEFDIFWDMAMDYSARWKTIIFGVPEHGEDDPVAQKLHRCIGVFDELEFPALESLYVSFLESGKIPEDLQEDINDLGRFYELWKLPRLRHATSINYVPSFDITPPLVSLDVTLKTDRQYGAYELNPLVILLENVPQLESLRIVLDEVEIHEEEQDNPSFDGAELNLPHLSNLVFSFKTTTRPESDLAEVIHHQVLYLFDSLTLPVLRQATIDISCVEKLDFTLERDVAIMGQVVRPLELSQVLTELDVTLDFHYDEPPIDSALRPILSRLRYLQHLRIGGRGFVTHAEPELSESEDDTETSPGQQINMPASPLQTLLIDGCSTIDITFLEHAVRRHDAALVRPLEKIIVRGDSKLQREEVVALVGAADLVWEVSDEEPS